MTPQISNKSIAGAQHAVPAAKRAPQIDSSRERRDSFGKHKNSAFDVLR